MTARKLMQLQYAINADCYNMAKESGLISKYVAGPIYDGVPDENSYLATDPKVLWILQEPHDSGCPKGESKGNWSVPKDMILVEDYGWGNPTHEALAKVMYAFRNGIEYLAADMKFKTDENLAWKIMETLKSTAWINVSKMPCPNGKSANMQRIRRDYKRYWKEIVVRQVREVFFPDIVVVAGAQWDPVADDLMLDAKECSGYPYQVDRWRDADGRQFLWVDHPTARKGKCFDVWVKALVDAAGELCLH